MKDPQLSTYDHALLLLNQREHSCSEVRHKLKSKGHSDELITKVIEELTTLNYLNDERFAEVYIRSKANRGFGPNRLYQELHQKGLAGEVIKSALNSAEIDWFEAARELKLSKFGSSPAEDFKQKSKQMRHLQYKGFNYEQIQYALSSTLDNND
ncbi:regulatory protein RecX [Marinomonas sp. THO17]|uniref:regulatory protein RecX n=1 Tax=Marinomonas sp. THO17 TaxID=3149048 RepID=UPI00336C0F3A